MASFYFYTVTIDGKDYATDAPTLTREILEAVKAKGQAE